MEKAALCCEGEEVNFFLSRRRMSTNSYDEDENMNDSLIEQMLVLVFACITPGKALNTLSCEAIVVRFG